MVQNYYSLKQEAHKLLMQAITHLHTHPTDQISTAGLALEFQRLYGFSETTLNKMLKPFINTKQIKITTEGIITINNEEVKQ